MFVWEAVAGESWALETSLIKATFAGAYVLHSWVQSLSGGDEFALFWFFLCFWCVCFFSLIFFFAVCLLAVFFARLGVWPWRMMAALSLLWLLVVDGT